MKDVFGKAGYVDSRESAILLRNIVNLERSRLFAGTFTYFARGLVELRNLFLEPARFLGEHELMDGPRRDFNTALTANNTDVCIRARLEHLAISKVSGYFPNPLPPRESNWMHLRNFAVA